MACFVATLVRPWRLRVTSLVHHMQDVGLNAVPIVTLMAFLIGVVLAFMGAVTLRQFGAEVFVVDLIAITILRELGVLMAAIIVAGRTASAYTAAIGSMKLREEIDAMRTLSLDPIEVLVLPRMLALIIMLPLLGFVANIAGLVGGGLMAWINLGISPALFASRLVESSDPWNFLVGMIQTPFFAIVIGLVGCYEGMKVEKSAESLGARTSDLGGAGAVSRHRHQRRVLGVLHAARRMIAPPTEAAREPQAAAAPEAVIEVRGLVTRFGANVIHQDLDLDVYRGEVLGVVGGSGTGKSVLLREIVGLMRPAAGSIRVFGVDMLSAAPAERRAIENRWGVMFQDGALFSSLTVRENVEAPMRVLMHLDPDLRRSLAELKVAMVGLPPNACDKYPSDLSGGMRKRAGLARALALDPEIVFLDEPTAGLDPISATAFDEHDPVRCRRRWGSRCSLSPTISTPCTPPATASRCLPRSGCSSPAPWRRCWRWTIRGFMSTFTDPGRGRRSPPPPADRETQWRPARTTC